MHGFESMSVVWRNDLGPDSSLEKLSIYPSRLGDDVRVGRDIARYSDLHPDCLIKWPKRFTGLRRTWDVWKEGISSVFELPTYHQQGQRWVWGFHPANFLLKDGIPYPLDGGVLS